MQVQTQTDDVVEQAILYLAGHCDGANQRDGSGFNKNDSEFGHSLSGKIQQFGSLTDSQRDWAWKMITKYRNQLYRAGIVLPNQKPDRPKKVVQGPTVKSNPDGTLTVAFEYSADIVAAIKTLPYQNRKFDPATKTWTITRFPGDTAKLQELIPGIAVNGLASQPQVISQPKSTPPVRHNSKEIMLASEDEIRVSFPYDARLVQEIKGLFNASQRRFDTETKSWFIKRHPGDVELLRRAFPIEEGWQFDPAIESLTKMRDFPRLTLPELRNAMPDGSTLFAHQIEGIERMYSLKRCFNCDEMGLGKTRQGLLAGKYLKYRIIVIGPVSLHHTWITEAERMQVPIEYYSWSKIPAPLENEVYTLIVDEAHYAQSFKSNRTQKFMKLALDPNCKGLFMLTGTPFKNGRPENGKPLLTAMRHPLVRDPRYYDVHFCQAKTTPWSKWDTTGAAHLEELYRELEPVMIRRRKKDCLDLPEKIRTVVQAEVDKEAKSEYSRKLAELKQQYHERLAAGEIKSGGEALVFLNHLRHAGSVAKVSSAIELAQSAVEGDGVNPGQSVVIFTEFKESARKIADVLGCDYLSGETDKDERAAMVERLQSGQSKVLVASLKAGGVGLTMTAATVVILVDRPWTPGDAEQAEDRLHRIGQSNKVTSIWLQYGPMDQKVDQLLQSKSSNISQMLDGKHSMMDWVEIRYEDLAKEIFGG